MSVTVSPAGPSHLPTDINRTPNAPYRDATSLFPSGVFTLDPPTEFCSEPIASDLDYRWDGVHYYLKGAKLYFDTVLPQLVGTDIPAS